MVNGWIIRDDYDGDENCYQYFYNQIGYKWFGLVVIIGGGEDGDDIEVGVYINSNLVC